MKLKTKTNDTTFPKRLRDARARRRKGYEAYMQRLYTSPSMDVSYEIIILCIDHVDAWREEIRAMHDEEMVRLRASAAPKNPLFQKDFEEFVRDTPLEVCCLRTLTLGFAISEVDAAEVMLREYVLALRSVYKKFDERLLDSKLPFMLRDPKNR